MKPVRFLRRDSALVEVLESRIAPAVFVWSGAFSNTWNDVRNWQDLTTGVADDGFPGSGGGSDTAEFNDGTSPTITLSADVTIHSLAFLGQGSPKITGANFIFASNSDSPKILVNTATTPEVDSNIALSSTFPLVLDSELAAGIKIASDLILGGVLSDGFTGNPPAYGGFLKTGAGNVTISGAGSNTFPNTGAGSNPGTGPGFTVSAGGLLLNKSATKIAISSDLKITGGFVSISGSGEQIADAAAVEVDTPGLLQLTQNETIHQLSGTGTVNGASGTKLTLKADSNFAGDFGSSSAPTQFDLGITGTVLTLDGTEPGGTTAKVRIVGGVLNVSGSYPNLDIVLTGPGGTDVGVLTGTGSVGNVSTTGSGIVAPGTGTLFDSGTNFGTLSVNDLSGSGGGVLILSLDVTSTGNDAIDLRGTMASTVATQFNASSPAFSEGQVFQMFNVPGTSQLSALATPTQGGFTSLPEGATVADAGSDFPLHIHYNGGDSNDVVLVAEPNLTPIAPTSISADGKTATFLQEDGDTLTIKTSKGKFVAGNFLFEALPSGVAAGAGRLEQILLDTGDFNNTFAGAAITGTVTKGASGDGFADVGSVNASGIDLASFTLRGDLGQINAGDPNFKTPGLGTLSVLSLGAKGNLSYTAGAVAKFTSTIEGKLGTLSVTAGKLNSTNTPTLPSTAGTLGQAFVTTVDEGSAAANKFEGIGKVVIDQIDAQNNTGIDETIRNGGTTVAYAPGTILASGPIGSVLVNQSVLGGSSSFGGDLWSRISIGSVTIRSSLVGGLGTDSGNIIVGSPDDDALGAGKLGTVTIKGGLVGSGGEQSGAILGRGGIGAVIIGSVVQGGPGVASGSITSGAAIGSVTVKGTLQFGTRASSGSIIALGNIGTIKVTDAIAVTSASAGNVGIFSGGTIASISADSLDSAGGTGFISAFGKKGGGAAIGSIAIKGNVAGWDIAAGYDTTFDVTGTMGGTFNPDASIGTVTVGGTFTDSAITAGTLWGSDGVPGGFLHGNPAAPTDSHMPGDTLPRVLAKIAQITITGGSANSIFEAQVLTGLKIAGVKAPLTTGVDNINLANGTTAVEIE